MASNTKKEEVTMETRFEKMETRFEKMETRLDEMSNHLAKQDARHDEMMAFLRQSLADSKSRINAVESEQREQLVLLRESKITTELNRVEAQAVGQRVEMMLSKHYSHPPKLPKNFWTTTRTVCYLSPPHC